jgi:hypothetical protein
LLTEAKCFSTQKNFPPTSIRLNKMKNNQWERNSSPEMGNAFHGIGRSVCQHTHLRSL